MRAAVHLPSAPSLARDRPIRIVIVDDSPIFRDGLRQLLEAAPGLHIVADTSTAHARRAIDFRPDILILGLSTYGGVWPNALTRLFAARTTWRTILLIRSLEAPEIIRAFRFGAQGVVPKNATAETLLKCIESVMVGHYWVGHEQVANPITGIRRVGSRGNRKAFGLTGRELDIVRAVMDGDTNKEIAKRLSISENTVKCHLTHAFDKTGASTRVELALFAAHHHILN